MNAAILIGGAGLAGSIATLALGAPWIRPVFYLPAWWSLLVLAAGVLRRRKEPSWLLGPNRPALRLAAFSVPAWLIYEAANFRLRNWEYWDLPAAPALRWAGYILAFATVLPAILEFKSIATRHISASKWRARPGLVSPAAGRIYAALGVLSLYAALAWPAHAFALIWAPAFLFCEPWVAQRRPGQSWLHALSAGRPRPFFALLLSGLVCGLFWESLNYWAGAKWRYTVPWPQGPKLFEMPWLGYLGFPPFALGCASLWNAFDISWRETNLNARIAITVTLAILSAATLCHIDQETVRSFNPIW